MARLRSLSRSLSLLLFLHATGWSATLVVDPGGGGDFTAIQPALDAAADGDTVLVRAGEYLIDEPIDFNRLLDPRDPRNPPAKNITLRSEAGASTTVIRMSDTPADARRGSVVTFDNGETAESLLEGFTLTGGSGNGTGRGGGVFVGPGAGPRIESCTITRNVAREGGGVYSSGGFPSFTECTITRNSASASGGGVLCVDSSAAFTDSTVAGNAAARGGGGMMFSGGTGRVVRCVVLGNDGGRGGGGIFGLNSSVSITGSLVAGNSAETLGGIGVMSFSGTVTSSTIVANVSGDERTAGLFLSQGRVASSIVWKNPGGVPVPRDAVEVSRSCVDSEEPLPGDGNINVDPLFVREGVFDVERFVTLDHRGEEIRLPDFVVDAGDYRLREGSPCVDAGRFLEEAAVDLDGSGRPCGEGTDMGAFERGACPPGTPFQRGDTDGDGRLNITDAVFAIRALFAGGEQPSCEKTMDADDDGRLRITDVIFLLDYLFRGGPALPAPALGVCGRDPSPDSLGCESYTCPGISEVVVFLIDRSGSMQDRGELAFAKAVVSSRIQALPGAFEFAVNFFDRGLLSFPPVGGLVAADPANKTAALRYIANVPGGSGGCQIPAFLDGLDRVRLSEARRRRIVYFGDAGGTCMGAGEMQYLQQMVRLVTEENAGTARIDCFGIGVDSSRASQERFFIQLAEANGGEYQRLGL